MFGFCERSMADYNFCTTIGSRGSVQMLCEEEVSVLLEDELPFSEVNLILSRRISA